MAKIPLKISKSDEEVFFYITEIGNLMQMPRSHQRFLGNTFDNVASHSHHVAIIAYCIARMEGMSHEDGLKALAMGTVHDHGEARTGDLNFLEKHYATRDELVGTKDQLKNLPFSKDLLNLFEEYEELETPIAKCVKDADAVEQLYLEWILTYMGNKIAERWYLGDKKNRIPYFRTVSAKKLANLFYKNKPNDWWFREFIDKKFNKDHLNGKK